MVEIRRHSPVQFNADPIRAEVRDNWTVALEYGDEGQGPWLVDLAHKIRWDLQDNKIVEQTPCRLAVPEAPGKCTFSGNTLINRMNRTQASIYHLGPATPAMPAFSGYTDTTETTVFLALFGPKVFSISEKLSNLDLHDPASKTPFLLQGPFCHVPCQVVVLERAANGSGGFLLTCSRGYADSMVHAVLAAGAEFFLKPAGEDRFTAWINRL